MWIFTDTGFVSAVRKPEFPDLITVRARDRESLETLASKASVEIKRSPFGDYPFRVFVSVEVFNEWILDRTKQLNYKNFKSQVAKTRGSRFASALNDVWLAMLAVEPKDSREMMFDDEGQLMRHSDDLSGGK